jgi:RNA polymerase sigma-70 factor (ECF subfamily)
MLELERVLADAGPTLARIAAGWCMNEADARDLVQDTFERATRQGLPFALRNPRAWLVAIMHNLFIDRCRAAARRPRAEPLDEGMIATSDPPDVPIWLRLTVEDVRAALAELDAPFREVFALHELEDWTYEQVAAHLSIHRLTVGTRLTRARRKLRDVLVRRHRLELQR